MIISHEHRFVFVKTRKTAGSSIEVVLEPHAGADGIVTPLVPYPVGSGHTARNHRQLFNPVPDMVRRWDRTGRGVNVLHRGIFAPLVQLRKRRRFWEHSSYELIRERAGVAIDGYFTFCFERNPWDKALSWWLWAHRRRPELHFPEDFESWVIDPATKGFFSEWYMYTLDGSIAVDFVGRFEDLDHDLRTALDHIGIEPTVALPQEKRTERPAHTPISDRCHERIAEMFRHEIDAFGYTAPPQFVA